MNKNDKAEKFRVQKLLSNYGYCSRRKAEDLIIAGKVKVNGKLITIGDKASFDDELMVNDKKVIKERKTYLMFHKPLYCVTAMKDDQYQTVMDYIKIKERVFPVGRLDYNSSGMLLLTNDGDFANQIMHPKNETKKTYTVRLDKPLRHHDAAQLEKGVTLEDGSKVRKAKIYFHDPVLVDITIHEGKNRIIRRMFKAVGYHVRSLERVRIGRLELGSLKPGNYRSLNRKDMDKIFD